MIVDELSTSAFHDMAQSGTFCHTATSSLRSRKVIPSVDKTSSPTLADLIRSQKSMHKKKSRAEAHNRLEIRKPRAAYIERMFVNDRHPEGPILAAKLKARKPFKRK